MTLVTGVPIASSGAVPYACWQLRAMPQIVSFHCPAVAVTIVLSGILAGTKSAAIHCVGLFVGVVNGDKGSEVGSGPSRDSIGAVHSNLVAPMLQLLDDLSGLVPKLVGAASASVPILDIQAIADGEI